MMEHRRIAYDSPEQAILRRCPFCDTEVNCFEIPDSSYMKDGKCWVVECKNMGCILPRCGYYRERDDLFKAWNNREPFL